MNSSPSPETGKAAVTQRYEGLDAFRGFAAFGVVWLHTFQAGTVSMAGAAGPGSQSIEWLRLRDFSLPLIVMSSFFVLTISLLRKSESKFWSFFTVRFKRLWLPLFIWTSIYYLVWTFVMPEEFRWSSSRQLPSLDVFICGYSHLWFLQFIFLGSLIVYPVLRWLRGKNESERIKLAVLFFLAAGIYAVIFKLFIQTISQLFLLKPTVGSVVFISQATKYAFFIPVAIGLGLVSNKINDLYKQNIFRILSVVAVILSLIGHLLLESNALTAPVYGIAVFIATLQPWKRIPFRLVYLSAAYSYGIYIFHYLLCEALQVMVFRGGNKLNGAAIFSITILFYVTSFGIAVLLRKIIPVDWFIPLVPVGLRMTDKKKNP